MPARVAKAAKDAKTGRKAVKKVASKVQKGVDKLKEDLKKLEKFDKRKKDPGGSLPASRTVRYKANEGQKKIKPVQSKNRNSQVTEQKGALKGAGAVAALGGAGYMATKDNDYSAANVDLKSGKGLPVADMSESIHMEGTGSGIRYFQNGKEVRLPKKN